MFITDDASLVAAIERMRAAGTDLAEYEVKSASRGMPKEIAQSISAFANSLGGVIILGIRESGGFHAVDIDVKSVQAGLAQAARDLVQPPQMAEILVLSFEGKPVVVANVPEAPVREKPCYVRKQGRVGGSYIRTGDGDHQMSLYEIDRFIENQYRVARNDIVPVSDATIEDLDDLLLRGWLARTRETTLGRSAAMGDEELMVNRRLIAYDEDGVAHPTLAGLLALGSYPQSYFPRLSVVFTVYPTSKRGDTDRGGARFVDTVNVEGPIPSMVVEAVRAVSRNMRHGAIVKGALRENVPDYPLPAVREAVANALMHRDYSTDSHGTPVMVDLFPDRLEISNPGGLFGMLTVDKLGTRGATASRNQFLARILEDVPYTDYDGRTGRVVENRESGYPTINKELEEALMPAPVVRSTLDEFDLTLRHRRMTEEEGRSYTRKNVSEAIVSYLTERESASASEIARASGVSLRTVREYISRLIDDEAIEPIGSLNSPKRRYRISG